MNDYSVLRVAFIKKSYKNTGKIGKAANILKKSVY